ncbi:MAG: glycosyltransferase [Polymorphobacter sp.]
MRIVDVAEFYAPKGGGVRTYIDAKIEAGNAAGHEIVIIAPGPEDRTDVRGRSRIIWVKAPILAVDKRYHVFWSEAPVHALLEAEAPDLVEASSPWQGARIVAHWQSKQGQATPKVLFQHADPVASYPQQWFGGRLSVETIDKLFGFYWRYLRGVAAGFDEIVVGGPWMAQRLHAQGLPMPIPVPMGVDTKTFTPRRRSAALRAQLLADCGLGPDATLLIGVGRHHIQKLWPLAIDAVGRAQAAGANIGFVQIGDGMARKAVERAAARVPHVVLKGHVGDRETLASMLASGDALLHASSSETYGLAVAEALAVGLPLVAPAGGAVLDLLSPAWSESYAPHDAAAAAAAIGRFLRRDRDAMAAAAADAGANVVGDAAAHFKRLFATYARLAADHAPAR